MGSFIYWVGKLKRTENKHILYNPRGDKNLHVKGLLISLKNLKVVHNIL